MEHPQEKNTQLSFSCPSVRWKEIDKCCHGALPQNTGVSQFYSSPQQWLVTKGGGSSWKTPIPIPFNLVLFKQKWDILGFVFFQLHRPNHPPKLALSYLQPSEKAIHNLFRSPTIQATVITHHRYPNQHPSIMLYHIKKHEAMQSMIRVMGQNLSTKQKKTFAHDVAFLSLVHKKTQCKLSRKLYSNSSTWRDGQDSAMAISFLKNNWNRWLPFVSPSAWYTRKILHWNLFLGFVVCIYVFNIHIYLNIHMHIYIYSICVHTHMCI